MSEQNQQSDQPTAQQPAVLSKEQKLKESFQSLDLSQLFKRKVTMTTELGKMLQMCAKMDVQKREVRLNVERQLKKVNEQLLKISLIEQVIKEKDF